MRSRSRDTAGTAVSGETPLVDREAELERIRQAVASVAGGEPGILVFTGAAGTGKTRLAREALRAAAGAGFQILAGHADELGRDTAYAPFTEALAPALHAAVPDERARLTAGLDQLGLVFGGLGIDPPHPLGDPGLERARLVDGMAVLVGRLARRCPLAILIDDVHAADDGSAALVSHLTRVVTDQPVLLLLTGQPDDVADPRLARALAHVNAQAWWVERLRVSELDASASKDLLGHLFDATVAPALAEVIVDRCAGRPLLLEAVARSFVENDQIVRRRGVVDLADGAVPALPEDIRGQLSLHLAAISAEERRVVEILAVAGGRCEHEVLVGVSRLEHQDLETALDRLDRRRLLSDDGSGGYALAHSLLQETAIAELSAVQRRRLSADLATALEQRDPHDRRLAGHIVRAEGLIDSAHALRVLREAAVRFRDVGAIEDALGSLEAAAKLARRSDDQLTAGILSDLGRLYMLTGRRDDARNAWSEALAGFRAAGDANALSRLHRDLGDLAWTDGDVETAARHLAEAERALDGLEPTPEHAELLSTRLDHAMRTGAVDVVDEHAGRLLALARRLDLPQLAVRAALAAGDRYFAVDDLAAGEEKMRDGLRLAEQTEDPLLIMTANDRLSIAACLQGDLPLLRHCSTTSLDLVRTIGAASLEPWPRMRLVIADLFGGEWDAALRQAAEAVEISARYGSQRGRASVLATYAWMLVQCGRLDDARRTLDEALTAARPTHEANARSSSILAVAGCALSLAEGDAERAISVGMELADPHAGWFGTISVMVLGDALTAAGRADDTRELAARIRRVRSRTGIEKAVAAWLTSGAGDGADSNPLDACRRRFDALGFPFYAARAARSEAEAIAGEDPEQAIALAGDALARFDRLGAADEAQHARRLLRSLGVVPSRGRRREDANAMLSRRELDVARLVASGSTNAQVATALFISPRTVTTHLDHMYQRLGLNSRAALTRYLADSGLLETDAMRNT